MLLPCWNSAKLPTNSIISLWWIFKMDSKRTSVCNLQTVMNNSHLKDEEIWQQISPAVAASLTMHTVIYNHHSTIQITLDNYMISILKIALPGKEKIWSLCKFYFGRLLKYLHQTTFCIICSLQYLCDWKCNFFFLYVNMFFLQKAIVAYYSCL